eukprot:554122_1
MSDRKQQDTLVSLSDLGATKFIRLYYKVVDYHRAQITNFYRASSTIKWNGKNIGHNVLQTFWNQIPPSHHTLISVNAQPIPVLAMSSTPSILITVNGKVSYLGSKHTLFSQTFIIGAEPVQNNVTNGNANPSSQYF